MMPADMKAMLDMALSQVNGMAKGIQISWNVKEFSSINDLREFLADGKQINGLQVFIFDGKIIAIYGAAK